MSDSLKKCLLDRIRDAVLSGKSNEFVKSEIFMFYYCISYMKKDKNGKSMITDFSQILVSDLTVVRIIQEINASCDDNYLFVLLCYYFLGDCMTYEEHEECLQKVLDERRKRIFNACSALQRGRY